MNVREQLIQVIMSKANLSQEQAESAISAGIEFIKTKLPEPLASQVDNFLGGDGDNAGGGSMLGGLGGMLGGLFGRN
ncbi:MAG: hypothetical protein KIH69_020420 [Anaerolineae bacterium]|nr:hypothetical protein [Anaerolineae bacterium]